MADNKIAVKKRRLSKEIKSTIVDLGIRKSDVSYLIKNLLFNNTPEQLRDICERKDLPIAVVIFAHALINDFKKGGMANAASMMQWAFDNSPEKKPDDVTELSEEQLDEEIKKLLDSN